MNLYNGEIVDAHMHLWDIANGYEWTKNTDPFFGGGALHRNFLAPDFIEMCGSQNIKKFVHVEAACGGDDPVKETEWVQNQADTYGMPNAIVAHAKLDAPDIEQQLIRHCESPNMRGIRMLLSYAEDLICLTDRGDYMSDPQWLAGFALLSKYNLSFDMQVHDIQLKDVGELAKKFPETQIIIDHLGSPSDISPEGFKAWRDSITAIAKHDNVKMKISCIGCLFQKNDPQLITPYIQEVVKVFTADRCMVGSNCPPCGIHIPLHDIFELYKHALADLPEVEQHKIFYATAKESYRL